jgi:GWxTD domain-containing protein
LLFWAVLSVVFAGLAQQAPEDRLVGDVVRFLRGDRTLVNGFVRVPHRMLSLVTQGPGRFAAYRVDFRVTDEQGTVLATDAWSRRVAWGNAPMPGAQSVEPFAFAVTPGSYTVSIAVQDSASGFRQTVNLPLTGFGSRPRASDLLLAYGIRRVTGSDTLTGAGEVRKGGLFIESAPDLTLTPNRAVLWYYCEVYSDSAASIPWEVRVLGSDGRVVVASQPTRTAVAAGGGTIAASIDLGGLPPGSYTLALALGAGGADTATRGAPFRMGGFETEQAVTAATQSAPPGDDMFTEVGEATLDSLYEPLVYLASREELKPYEGLTVEGKRRFLREFWRRRDPTPGTWENELQTAFYARIADANRRFREGGAGAVPGWRTDRGRVFIVHGEPDDVLRRPQSGPDRPWEAWKYTKDRITKFVFLDLTRLGNYSLIFTDDKQERSPFDWTTLLSSEAILEIQRF